MAAFGGLTVENGVRVGLGKTSARDVIVDDFFDDNVRCVFVTT